MVTDLTDFTLSMAQNCGADTALNTKSDPEALKRFHADKGHFDVLFECTGVAAALASAIPALRPGAVIAQLGLGGDMVLPMQAVTAKELQLRGSFRFHQEFFTGVTMMQKGLIDVKPLITQTVPLEEAVAAFEMASDRTKAMKAQISFD